MKSVETVDFAECPPIKPISNEDVSGPICEFNYCIRNCRDGFKPMRPKKVCFEDLTHACNIKRAYKTIFLDLL